MSPWAMHGTQLPAASAARTTHSHCVPQVAFSYFTTFIKTMRREWFGIDRLRLDKFLMLIRVFVAQIFKDMAASKW